MIKDIISIASIKGGVGKSVTAIMFSMLLSKKEKVLLIDLDSQASTTSFFYEYIEKNKNYNIVKYNTYTLLKEEEVFEKIKLKISDNLDIIPSYIDLAKFSKEHIQGHDLCLKNSIFEHMNDYDYIIIDTPPSLSYEFNNAILLSTKIVVPMPTDLWATESLELLIDATKGLFRSYFKFQKFDKHIFLLQTMYSENRIVDKELEEFLLNNYRNMLIGKIHNTTEAKKIAFVKKLNKKDRFYLEYKSALEKVIGYGKKN